MTINMSKTVLSSLIVSLLLIANTLEYSSTLPLQKAIAQAATIATTKTNFLTYTNSTYGIRIQYPSNWEKIHTSQSIVAFRSPLNSRFAIMIPLSLPQDMTLSAFSNASIKGISKTFESFNLTASSLITIAGNNPAEQIVFNAKVRCSDLRFLGDFVVKDGKGYSIAFGSPIEQYSKDLPNAEKMINSFQILNMNPPLTSSLSPSSDVTAALMPLADLRASKEQYISAWNHTEFHSQFDTYVNSTEGYGVYDVHKSNIFEPGEDIILYVEPVGFTHMPIGGENNTKLYLVNLTASIILSDKQGNILFGKEDIPILNLISHNKNTEVSAKLRLTQTSPFPPANYLISYVITDVHSGKNFKIVKNITISGSNLGKIV